jgi:hypothetical protein
VGSSQDEPAPPANWSTSSVTFALALAHISFDRDNRSCTGATRSVVTPSPRWGLALAHISLGRRDRGCADATRSIELPLAVGGEGGVKGPIAAGNPLTPSLSPPGRGTTTG